MTEKKTSRQLYALSRLDFMLPDYVDHNGRLLTRPADNLPLLVWPDGRWCHAANSFMRELLEKGYSRHNRGGTLSTSAAHISHLIRYCAKHRIDFLDLTDSDFRSLIGELIREDSPRDPSKKRRGANSVIAIGRSCLAFLDSAGRQSGFPTFVEERIRACVRVHEVVIPGARGRAAKKTVRYWHHPAFPKPDPFGKRLPISSSSIESLRKAVGSISASSHRRARRHTMLKLLEVTGARRGEIALIGVKSVRDAEAMQHPMLRVPTLKTRGGRPDHRLIPISRADLAFIRQYIEVHRRSVIRRRLTGVSDHGILLVNGVNGKALQPNTITHEVRLLANAAGLDESACPHMFRHRFLTKLFVALLEQHAVDTPDDFRRLLLDSEELKRKVAEWTGHSRLESLERYIELAFDEVGNFKRSYDTTRAGLAIDSFIGTLESELEALASGEAPSTVAARLMAQLVSLRSDLAYARTPVRHETP